MSQTLAVDAMAIFGSDSCFVVGPHLHCAGQFTGAFAALLTPVLNF